MDRNNRNFVDWIMQWQVLKPFKPIYYKYREGFLYLVFGGITVLIAIVSYTAFIHGFGIDVLVSNAISWVLGVTFSYIATKKWVFEDKCWRIPYVFRQAIEFYMARAATLFLQEFLLYVFVSNLGCSADVMKILTEFINIVLNYIVSKFVIFSKRNSDD